MARWKPGQSGNPAGGKPGTVKAHRKLFDGKGDALVRRMIELAESGDFQALKWCCDRLIGPMRPESRPVTVTLPEGAPLSDQGRAVLAELGRGTLAADEAAALLAALMAQYRLVELSELLPKLEQLESERTGR